jgi:hypothetical protein
MSAMAPAGRKDRRKPSGSLGPADLPAKTATLPLELRCGS